MIKNSQIYATNVFIPDGCIQIVLETILFCVALPFSALLLMQFLASEISQVSLSLLAYFNLSVEWTSLCGFACLKWAMPLLLCQ